MKRTYPKESMLLLCEQARQEANKKITLIGWYGPGDEIVFQPEPGKKPPYAVANLAFVVVLKGGSGNFSATFSVEGPEGENIVSPTALKPQTIAPEKPTALIIVQVAGASFQSLGEYTVCLKLERKTYKYKFKVSVSQQSGRGKRKR